MEKLSAMHCTDEEVATVLEVSVDTITRNFADHIKSGKAKGRASLRRVQWQAAQNGNPTMMIWLGKQLLGQKDHVETTIKEHVREVRWTVVDPREESQAPKKAK